jgi:predicted CoA-binding protein
MKKTVVIGASANPQRYSYLAVNRFVANGHPVVAIGSRPGFIGSVPIITGHPAESDVDTISLYVNPEIQKKHYDYIFSLHSKRIILNPGTENEALCALAKEKGI